MYEKILVPLDGSELAEVALPYAEELAGRLNSEVTLVHVFEWTKDTNKHMNRFYLDKMVEATKQGAKRFSNKSEKQTIRIKSQILVGNPAEEIVEQADEEDIGLIVMATHGESGVKRWALGSVADKVVRATNRPVALIRAKGVRPDVRKKGILKKALVPLDGSKEAEEIVPYVQELASKLKADVVLFQVIKTTYETINAAGYGSGNYTEQQIASEKAFAEDYLGKIGSQLKQKGVTVTTKVRFGNAAEEIIKLADEMCADVVGMSTHGRSGIGRWVLGSVAGRILHEGTTPLLLVRSPRTAMK